MSLLSYLTGKRACRMLAGPQGEESLRYGSFKELLAHNDALLDALAALEQTYHGGEPFTPGAARQAILAMGRAAQGMAAALDRLSRGRHDTLPQALGRILPQALSALDPPGLDAAGPLVLRMEAYPFPKPRPQDKPLALKHDEPDWPRLAGGKADHLARVRAMTGLHVPEGFVVTTAAFAAFMRANGLEETAGQELDQANPLDLQDLEARCGRIRQALLAAPLPERVRDEIARELASLAERAGAGLLAVRSSAVGEDGAISFAGQYDSVLNVSPDGLEDALRRVFASKYSPRAVLYRLRHGLDDADVPMAALVLTMVPCRASGVLYTLDPAAPRPGRMRLDGVAGLGDAMVAGEAAPFSLAIESGMTVEVPPGAPFTPEEAATVAQAGEALEKLFGSPQDVEWCLEDGGLVILQSRPMEASRLVAGLPEPDLSGRRVLASGGVTASPGTACGVVVLVQGGMPSPLPEGAVLVAAAASPELAALLDRAGAVVTRSGSAASHLASVAREMDVPALFGLPGCLEALPPGQTVTVDAAGARVFEGCVEELLNGSSRRASRLMDSPLHRRLRTALDHVSPLTLKDPRAANFTPAGCETLHDIARFAHEMGMRAMFGLSGEAGEGTVPAARLKAAIPLSLYCMDLGGGLRENLTDCDTLRPEDIRSAPMLALWRGFTHPGITWAGTMAFDPRSFLTLLATSATAEVDGGQPGGDSYALLGGDYLNLSARFAYHFANIDAFLGSRTSGNHVSLRFGGGAGGFAGKSLRVAFLGGVLSRLGFSVTASGDVLDATLKGASTPDTEQALDQLGRLMASSRLLDVAISSGDEAVAMAEAFLAGNYDLLAKRPGSPLPGFHLAEGDWERLEENGRGLARQDGSKWATGLSRGLAGLLGRLAGQRYQKFLDSIGAYFHFPLAVAKDSQMEDGRARVLVRPVEGAIDRAGGLAFAVENAGTYLVLRLNALENNLILFAFRDGRRRELASAFLPVRAGEWRELAVDIVGSTVTGLVDGKPYIVHHFDRPPRGFLGLWTKADSVTDFAGLESLSPEGELRTFAM